MATVLRARKEKTPQNPLWRVDMADDGVTILLTIAASPEWETASTLRLNSEDAARLAHELTGAARATAGNPNRETFVPGDVIGMRCTDACRLLRALGLTPIVVDAVTGEEASGSAATGEYRVEQVDPPVETVLHSGETVRLHVAVEA